MALVGLSPYTTDLILNQVEAIFWNKHGKLPEWPISAPLGVGDEAYSLVLPPENEKAFKALVPDWAFPESNGVYLHIKTPDGSNGYVYAPYKDPHINVYGDGVIRNASGIEQATYRSGYIEITPATDGSTIKQPALRDFVASVMEVSNEHKAARDEVYKARKDMADFLRPHRTLQKAVKAFGPSLMEYVPAHIKASYNREPVKREKIPKPEVVPVNVDHLVAAAVSHKLSLH